MKRIREEGSNHAHDEGIDDGDYWRVEGGGLG